MASQVTDRPVITENLISRTSVPNGCLGVCPETREIVLGAGFGYEPYRLYVDRFRFVDDLDALKKVVNHDEGEVIVVINNRHFYFYKYHQSRVGWTSSSGETYTEDIPADVGYWEFLGTFQIDPTAQKYLAPPETWEDKHFLVLKSDGTLIDSGYGLQDFLSRKLFNSHVNNSTVHVTQAEKATWNGKQGALTTVQLKAVNSGVTAEFVSRLTAMDFSGLDFVIRLFKFDGVEQPISDFTLDIPLSFKAEQAEGPTAFVSEHTVTIPNRTTLFVPGYMYGDVSKDILVRGPGNKLVWHLRRNYDTDEGYEASWSVVGQSVKFRQIDGQIQFWDGDTVVWTSPQLPEDVDSWTLSPSLFVNGQELIKFETFETPILVPYNVSLYPPEANAGYSRQFLLWLDDPTGKAKFSLKDASYTSLPQCPVDVENLKPGYYRVTELVSQGLENQPRKALEVTRAAQMYEPPETVPTSTFLVEHLDSTYLLDKINDLKNPGSANNPLPSPFFVQKDEQVYQVDILDDQDGIDFNISKVL